MAGLSAAAEPAPSQVLIGSYQALGVEAKQLAALEKSLRAAVGSLPVKMIGPDEAEKLKKGLTMCGEDAACLSGLGERVGARWVLGHGVAKVGASLLVNLLWVDVQKGKTAATASKRMTPAELATAGALVEGLVKGIELVPPPEPPPTPPPAVLVPVAAAAPPLESAPVVQAPRPRPLRAAAIATGAATGVAALSTVVLGVMAQSNYQQLAMTRVDQRAAGMGRQGSLNLGADLALAVGIATAVTTVVFLVMDQAGK